MTTIQEITELNKLVDIKLTELRLINRNLLACIAASDETNIKYFNELSAETQTQINKLWGRIAGAVQVELIHLKYNK